MKKKLRCFFLIFIAGSYASMAQKPLRVEVEAKSFSESYNIVPVGKEGVLLFNESNEKMENKTKKWYFTKYDTNFKEVWSKEFPVDKYVDFQKYYLTDTKLYIFFREGMQGAFQILDIDIKGGMIKSTNGKILINSEIKDFSVLGDEAYFGGNSVPSSGQVMGRMCLAYAGCFIPLCFGIMDIPTIPVLMNINLKTGVSKLVPILYKGSTSVIDINVNKNASLIEVALRNLPTKKESHYYVKSFGANATLVNTAEINPKGTNVILNGRIISVSAKEKLLIGTYASPAQKVSFMAKLYGLSQVPGSSNGFYITKLTNNNQDFIQYYNFNKFIKSKSPVKKTVFGGKVKETEASLLNYNLLVHDIIQKDDQYIMIAEAYYPVYHTETYTTMNANGTMSVSTRQVFDGFQYNNAIVAGFDKTGVLVWNNSFEINDILTFNLKERIKVLTEGDKTIMVYNYGGEIRSKVIRGKEVVEGKASTKIENAYAADVVKEDVNSDIDYWYDNFFVAHGYQKIKNTENSGGKKDDKKADLKRKRIVFYFNKIAFQ